MVKRNYTGVSSPQTAFAELLPFRNRLIKMGDSCRPFGTDYLILSAVVKALDTAAYHFTRNPAFYAIGDAATIASGTARKPVG